MVGGDQVLKVVEVQHTRSVSADQQQEQLSDLNQLPKFFWQWERDSTIVALLTRHNSILSSLMVHMLQIFLCNRKVLAMEEE